jgi:hypothetical protein
MPRGSDSVHEVQPEVLADRAPAPGARSGRAKRAVPPAAPRPGSWPAFTRALAGVLAVLEDEQCLILQRTTGEGFVQVAAEAGGPLRLEAVSSHYLEGKARLDRARVRRLRQLGWLPPTHAPGKKKLTARERKGSPNFYIDLGGRVDHAAAAELLVTTLREVYGVRSPASLAYIAFADAGSDILLPTLGIGREQPSVVPEQRPVPRRPGNAGQLQGFILDALKAWTGRTGLEFDDDGDLLLSRGDVPVLLRVDRKAPFVDVFSTVLHDVEPCPELMEALNDRNNAARCVVLTLMGTRVVASVSVDAAVFVPELFKNALTALADAVEEARAELRPRFGGRTSFDGDPTPTSTTSEPRIN